MDLEGALTLAIGIPVALVAIGSYVGILVIASKAELLSRQLGGDPPDYFKTRLLWGLPVPRFWDYLRRQCRRPGTYELARLMRIADVLLTTRMVLVLLIVVAMLVNAILN